MKPLLLLPLATISINAYALAINAMTYNIRYDNPDDGVNKWQSRKQDLVNLMSYYHPDFIGIQEGLNHQVAYIDDSLKEYHHIGIGRDGLGVESEAVAIFYNTKKYKLLKETTFWLSETPDKISRGWDAALNRISTYGQFKNITTGQIINIFNCHFDNNGVKARENSAKIILAKIKLWNLLDTPLIVMGDLNSTPDEKPAQIFSTVLNDSRKISMHNPYGPIGTFNDFNTLAKLDARIDYIFSKNLKVLSTRNVDDRRRNGLWVSDHLPVLVKFAIENHRNSK